MFHDHEMAGHPGELETYNSVKAHYWWPGMHMFVKELRAGMWSLSTIQDQPIPSQSSLSAYCWSQNHSPIRQLLYGLDH